MSIHKDVPKTQAIVPHPTPSSSIAPGTQAPVPSTGNGDLESQSVQSIASTTPQPKVEVLTAAEQRRKTSTSKYAESRWRQENAKAFINRLHLSTIWKHHVIVAIVGAVLFLVWFLPVLLDGPTEFEVDYTDCMSINHPYQMCKDIVKKNKDELCICRVDVKIDTDLKGKIHLDYKLLHFYQNQRHYLESRDNDQLKGHIFDGNGNAVMPKFKVCAPFRKNKEGKIIYPCGKIANSYFSDVIQMEDSSGNKVPWRKVKAIETEAYRRRLSGPSGINNHTDPKFNASFTKPLQWTDDLWQEFWNDGGVEGDQFRIWMRTAAFSKFRNSYRYFDKTLETCKGTMKGIGICKGNYTYLITYRFDMGTDGRKLIVLSTDSFFTDKKYFISIFLMVLAVVSGSLAVPSFLRWLRLNR